MAWERARTGSLVRDVTLSSLRALVADLVVVLGRMVAFPTSGHVAFQNDSGKFVV